MIASIFCSLARVGIESIHSMHDVFTKPVLRAFLALRRNFIFFIAVFRRHCAIQIIKKAKKPWGRGCALVKVPASMLKCNKFVTT